MTSAIEVRRVWKAFHDRRTSGTVLAVEDVSLDVAGGEFVCLVGPSGCGKTTLLRILAGLETATAGEVRVAGDRPPGMVFQEASVFPWLSVQDNIAYPLRVAGMGRAEQRARVEAMLELTGLGDFRRALPHQLSGGMKQRTAVARALVDDRPTLLMDEPFGSLDEQTRVALQQELLRIWGANRKTVLFITHSVEEALTLSDRVLVMSARPGRVVAEVPVPFARPRDVFELRRDPRYGEITYQIWQLLRRPDGALDAPRDAPGDPADPGDDVPRGAEVAA
jgi:NitT/TauT family transport system ATP-binding protein